MVYIEKLLGLFNESPSHREYKPVFINWGWEDKILYPISGAFFNAGDIFDYHDFGEEVWLVCSS
jgi:hypothetical protein